MAQMAGVPSAVRVYLGLGFQFRMTVIGEAEPSVTAELSTNDCPSAETTYCCRYAVDDRAAYVVANSARGRSGFNGAVSCWHADRNRHHPIIRPDKKQFLALGVPARLSAAANRRVHLAAGAGKRPDVDFVASGLVRLIRDPVLVWRELRLRLSKLGLHEREWLAVFIEGERPDVAARFWIHRVIQEKSAVRVTSPSETSASELAKSSSSCPCGPPARSFR